MPGTVKFLFQPAEEGSPKGEGGGAEDFSYIANEVPGFYISLGGQPRGKAESEVAAHHTPGFFIDESGFDNDVKAMAAMAWQYMIDHQD